MIGTIAFAYLFVSVLYELYEGAYLRNPDIAISVSAVTLTPLR